MGQSIIKCGGAKTNAVKRNLGKREWLKQQKFKNPNFDRTTSQLVKTKIESTPNEEEASCKKQAATFFQNRSQSQQYSKPKQNIPVKKTEQQISPSIFQTRKVIQDLSYSDIKTDYILYTDGAYQGRMGGWAYIWNNTKRGTNSFRSGAVRQTTNNRMEMVAVINGLNAIPDKCASVKIVSDSMYLLNGMRSWMWSWAKHGWSRKGGELKNVDLWKQLYALVKDRKMAYQWVKGHSGHVENERCDAMASAAIRRLR